MAIPTRPQLAVRALAAAAVLAAGLAACAGGSTAVEPLPPPPSTSSLPPTTVAVDRSGMALPGVEQGRGGTTTSLPMGPGAANITGKVLAPDGTPMASANVKVERLIGGQVATMDLLSGPDGAFSVPNVLGGAYRVRAWRSPDLGQVDPALVFVAATETRDLEMKLERHFGTTPLPTVAPLKPIVGDPTNMALQLSNRSVDAAGLIQGTPMAGVTVALDGGGGWVVLQPNPTVTDASGRARWQLVCAAVGVQPMRLVVNGVEQFQLALPACAPQPTPPPPTSAPAATTSTTKPGATTTRPPTTVATTTTRAGPPTSRRP